MCDIYAVAEVYMNTLNYIVLCILCGIALDSSILCSLVPRSISYSIPLVFPWHYLLYMQWPALSSIVADSSHTPEWR